MPPLDHGPCTYCGKSGVRCAYRMPVHREILRGYRTHGTLACMVFLCTIHAEYVDDVAYCPVDADTLAFRRRNGIADTAQSRYTQASQNTIAL